MEATTKNQNRKLIKLERKTGSVEPVGEPKLFILCGEDVGVNCRYFQIEGMHGGDRESLIRGFTKLIEGCAPGEADYFVSGNMRVLEHERYMKVGIPVQYYKK